MDDNKYESLKLKNQLCFPIYLCSKEIIRRYNKMLNKINLTYTQYVVMMYFWEMKESNVTKLGNILLLDSSTLTPLLKKLEEKGYIRRKRSDYDERNLIVKITEKGEKLKDLALDIPKCMNGFINLSEEEATTLYMLIGKILINLGDDNNGNNYSE